MATNKKLTQKTVETLQHEADKRVNIPSVKYHSVESDGLKGEFSKMTNGVASVEGYIAA